MLRSLMTAVTGVRAHQVMLDVTGNNIANVNTTGFKKDVTIFQDILYQTTQGATAPGDARGGINPAQVGLGVKVGAIETIHTQGAYKATGNKTDMLINGEGYYVLRDGASRIYSRAGNFTLDADKYLVHSGTGYRVQGYAMTRDPLDPTNFLMDGAVSDIEIPMQQKMEARATTLVGYQCNLNSNTEPYLPIGYADIQSTSRSLETKVLINNIPYTMTFNTNLTASGDGKNYFTVRVNSGGSMGAQDIQFNMVGVDAATSMPILSVVQPASKYYELPNGEKTKMTVDYSNATGVLQFRATTGATLWRTNLQQNMSYESFTIGSGNNRVDLLVEFNEAEDRMDKSPIEMTVWWQLTATSGSTGPAPMQKVVYDVFVNPDGTFDEVQIKSGSGTKLPNGYTWEHDLQLLVASGAKGLEFKASTAPDSSAIPTLANTVGVVNQGESWPSKAMIYDCQGKEYTLEVVFKKLTGNRWRWEASLPGDEKMFVTPSSGELLFDDSCKLVDPLTPQEVTIDFGMNATSFQTVKLDFSGQSFGLDVMEGVTQFASESTTKPYYQDGYTMGVLNNFSVGKDGVITGQYTNGVNIPLYRVALAQFANPMGLEKVGDTMFRETVNSGAANINAAGTNGGGRIEGGNLEMSNVDLTEEFTNLIIAQRGFQANTRVVTTSDQILEEVVNLKR